MSSFLAHLGTLIALPLLLMLLPKPAKTQYEPPEMISLRSHEPITFSQLPKVSSSGSGSNGTASPRPSGSSSKAAIKRPSAPTPPASPALPDVVVYVGAQEIRSTPPHPTNRVQTIVRPDLVKAPKLKFAIRLPSMVVSPPALPAFTAPTPQKNNAETPKPEVAVVAEKLIDKPALPMPASPPHAPGSDLEPAAAKPETKPQFTPPPLPDAAISTKAALVVNAVPVLDSGAKIPDAEIAGSFVVLPARARAETPSGSGGSSSSDANTNSKVPGGGGADSTGKAPAGTGTVADGTGAGVGSGKSAGTVPGTGSGSAKGAAGSGGSGTAPGGSGKEGTGAAPSGKGLGSGSGTGLNSGSGNGSFPGITILGGSGGRSRSSASPRTRPGYDLTIVAGGSSGGASHDLGVFGRNETVYTVYINMADAGGGPDWSMQYSLAAPEPAGNGLLSPPVAVKKTAAVCGCAVLRQRRVFISGTIDESGSFQGLRPLGQSDDLSKISIDALAGWKFLPAELAGKVVTVKVLIGVVPSDSSQQGK